MMFVVEQPFANSMVPRRKVEPLQKIFMKKSSALEEGFPF